MERAMLFVMNPFSPLFPPHSSNSLDPPIPLRIIGLTSSNVGAKISVNTWQKGVDREAERDFIVRGLFYLINNR
jgi:hypothetical protein